MARTLIGRRARGHELAGLPHHGDFDRQHTGSTKVWGVALAVALDVPEACGLDGAHRLHPCRLGRRVAHRRGFGTLLGGRPRAVAHHRKLQRPTDQPNGHPRLVGNPQCGAPDGVAHVRTVRGPSRLRSPLDTVGHPENKPPRRDACSCGRSRVATTDPGPWMGVETAWAHVVHAAKSRGVGLLGQPDRAPHMAEVL